MCKSGGSRYGSAQYRDDLRSAAPDVVVPFGASRGLSACHLLPILLPEGFDRGRFMEAMKEYGVQTSIHYPPVHQFQIYSSSDAQGQPILPMTDRIAAREVTLPLYPALADTDVRAVVQAVREALNR